MNEDHRSRQAALAGLIAVAIRAAAPLAIRADPALRTAHWKQIGADLGLLTRVLEIIHSRWCPPSLADDLAKAIHFLKESSGGAAYKDQLPASSMRAVTAWLGPLLDDARNPLEFAMRSTMYLVVETAPEGRVAPVADANHGIYLLANPIWFEAIAGTRHFQSARLQPIEGKENLLELLTRCRDSGIRLVSTSIRVDLAAKETVLSGRAIEDVLRALERHELP